MIDLTEFLLRGKVPKITESDAFKRIQEKAELVLKNKSVEAPAKQAKLFPTPWSDNYGIGANTIVRSAIFGTFDRQAVYTKRDTVYCYEKAVTLRVQGEALNQTDYDVFQLLLVASAVCKIETGTKFKFTRYALRKALGWPNTGSYIQRLDDSLTRLASFVIDLTIEPCKLYPKGWRFSGSLIQLGRDTLNTEESMLHSYVRVNMHEELQGFFLAGTYHMENLIQRKQLGKNQLAKALHSFYSSHSKPIGISLDELKLVLNRSDEPKHFKQKIKVALKKLEEVGFFESTRIGQDGRGDVLYVVRGKTAEELKREEERESNAKAKNSKNKSNMKRVNASLPDLENDYDEGWTSFKNKFDLD